MPIEYSKWIQNYKLNLSMLRDDLNLVLDKNSNIYISLDFYDIFSFSFPYAYISEFKKGSFWRSVDEKREFYKFQLARACSIFMLKNLYTKPILLLKPYILENNEFYERMHKQFAQFISKNYEKSLQSLEMKYINEMRSAELTGNYIKLVDFIRDNSPELLYFIYTGYGCLSGENMYDLMICKLISPDLARTDKEEKFKNKFKKVSRNMYSMMDIEAQNKIQDLRQKVNDTRKSKTKLIQNERDARSIYDTYYLNKSFNDQGHYFILLSSANHMQEVLNKYNKTNFQFVNQDSHDFQYFRDMEFFYIILVELAEYFKENRKGDAIDLEKFRDVVNKDLKKLDSFFDFNYEEDPQIGEILREAIKSERYDQIIKLHDKIQNMNLGFLLNIIKKEDVFGFDLAKFIEPDQNMFCDHIAGFAKFINLSYQKDEIVDTLFEMSTKIEKQRLAKLWKMGFSKLPDIYRELDRSIILFNLPFRLNTKHNDAKKMIEKIINENREAKLDIKRYHELPPARSGRILDLMKELSQIVDEAAGDEKYLLWQVIFLFGGQHSLVDSWYDIFNNIISEKWIRKELVYLYLINFIRQMRIKYIEDPDAYKRMAIICNKFIEDNTIFLNINLNRESQETLKRQLKEELEKQNIILDENFKFFILNDNYMAFYRNIHGAHKLYVIEGTINIKIYELDIRFVHLKSVLYNRFLHDFVQNVIEESLYGTDVHDEISIMKIKYKELYKDIVEKVDKEFEISIKSDFAYLCALSPIEGRDYAINLLKAFNLMSELEDRYESDALWGYSKYYIYAFICLKLCKHKILKKKSYETFDKSLDEIPEIAKCLREMVDKRTNELDSLLWYL